MFVTIFYFFSLTLLLLDNFALFYGKIFIAYRLLLFIFRFHDLLHFDALLEGLGSPNMRRGFSSVFLCNFTLIYLLSIFTNLVILKVSSWELF